MTAAQVPADDTTASAPVACSLTTEGLAEQAGRWVRLAARAMTGHTTTTDGLRLGFRPEPGIEEELRALAAVETQCCPWATWTVQASATQLVLEVRAAGDGVTVLHGMFTGLQQGAPVPR
jgi:MerR family transcriptional regulator, copper efflux regulator